MRRSNSIIWGLVLIAVSLVLLLNAFDIANINLFFDGWWTFFIIIPCFAGLFSGSDRGSNLIGLIVGILLFLACRDIFAFDILWKIFVPAIIALMGIKMIYKGTFARRNADEFPALEGNGNCGTSSFAAFSGRNLNYDNAHTIYLNSTCMFGGVDVK